MPHQKHQPNLDPKELEESLKKAKEQADSYYASWLEDWKRQVLCPPEEKDDAPISDRGDDSLSC